MHEICVVEEKPVKNYILEIRKCSAFKKIICNMNSAIIESMNFHRNAIIRDRKGMKCTGKNMKKVTQYNIGRILNAFRRDVSIKFLFK